ncbi:hypothetical protein ACS0TY_034468 [Phlomoides rotata]
MTKWIEELQDQPWSRAKKANDQPGLNWALNKTAGQVDMQFSVAITIFHILLDACIFDAQTVWSCSFLVLYICSSQCILLILFCLPLDFPKPRN